MKNRKLIVLSVLAMLISWSVPLFACAVVDDPHGPVITLNKPKVAVGEPIVATWTLTGDKAPYEIEYADWRITESNSSYEYRVKADISDGSSVFEPRFGVSAYFRLRVTGIDGLEEIVTSPSFTITGAAVPDQLEADYTVDQPSVTAGHPIGLSWLIKGGVPPYSVQAYWWITDEVNSNKLVDAVITGSSSTYTTETGGSAYFNLLVHDADGRTKSFMSLTFSISSTPIQLGDANGDNSIDIMDLVAIIDYIVSETPSTSMANADANGDGTVDIMDLVWIIDVIVGG